MAKFKIIMIDNGVESGSLTTSSPVHIIDNNSILLEGGVRVNTSAPVGIVYDEDNDEVIYLSSSYAFNNQSNPVVQRFIAKMQNRLNG